MLRESRCLPGQVFASAPLLFLLFARAAAAECVVGDRPPTGVEKQSYADAVAAFSRMAPPAPAGWVASAGPTDGVLTSVCAPVTQSVATWSLERTYERVGTADQKSALDQKVSVLNASTDALRKSNEAKIAENQKKMDAVNQRLQALAAAGKVAEIEPLMTEFQRLGDEQARLQGADRTAEAAEAFTARMSRDTGASFMVTVGEMNVNTRGFTPFVAPVGKGFRQVADDGRGNPYATLLVVLPPKTGQRGQTVVRISGDPARADSLLEASTLR